MQGCSLAMRMGIWWNIYFCSSLVSKRSRRGTDMVSCTSSSAKCMMFYSEPPPGQFLPAPRTTWSWAAKPRSSVRWKVSWTLWCSGRSQMAVCTHRSLSWTRWPVQTRASGIASSPMMGRSTARSWISKVGHRLLPNICNRRAAAGPNSCFSFRTRPHACATIRPLQGGANVQRLWVLLVFVCLFVLTEPILSWMCH